MNENLDLILDLLSQCGIKGKPNHKLDMPLNFCPFHDHNYRSGSLCVNPGKQQFICYVCGAGGSIRKIFYQAGLDVGDLYSQIKTKDDFSLALAEMLKDFIPKEEEKNKSDISEIEKYSYSHPYLINRGFTKEILAKNYVGFNRENARVTIPILFNGKYHGVIQRTVVDEMPRYLYPENLQKSILTYNAKPLELKNNDVEIWCEGSLDALKAAQCGYRARAILGGFVSTHQLKMINNSPKTIILAFDNDKAGNDATNNLLDRTPKANIYVFKHGDHKDIGELNQEQLDKGVNDAMHRLEYLVNA
jgi:DNA primase